MQSDETCFHDISLSPSLPLCRICHAASNDENEDLIQPCRCSGSIGYVHESCIRKWIVGSSNFACELCNYVFKCESKLRLDIRKIQFPRPSPKGWLHVLLFLAFFTIMLTSLTWIIWSQLSTSRAARSERKSREISYAYAVNGGFIIMALIGLYLDSFKQCRSYYKRWSLLNQELRIFPYDASGDLDCCQTGAGGISSPQNEAFNTTPAFHTREVSNSPNESDITEFPHRTNPFSCQNDGFASDVEMHEDSILNENFNNNAVFEETDRCHQWPIMASSYLVPTRTAAKQSALRQSMSVPADLRDILVLKETYV